ncbi:MAG: NfeD family protein [bacterium]|jgi:membrane protein implicated in regulation of membrane protease activity
MPTIFWLWLAAAVIFLIIEIGTPSLVFACFVVGSIGAAVTSWLDGSYLIQLAVFAGISIILIPTTRPLARKITKPSPQPTNVDAMIGKSGVVLEKIDPSTESGQVRVDGQVWRAKANEIINEGAKIKVLSVVGARLNVVREE